MVGVEALVSDCPVPPCMKLGLIYSKHPNFGDMLNEDLFACLGYDVRWACTASAEASGIGSILGWLVKDTCFRGLVLGSGLIRADDTFNCPEADIRLVRGPLTASRVSGLTSCPTGDPGVLLSRLFPSSRRRAGIGFAPHYQDQSNPAATALLADPRVRFVDVTKTPRQVAAEISSCDHIIASSLHALIAADSYQIPSTWVGLTPLRGGEFKFHDYFLGMTYDREPMSLEAVADLDELIRAGRVASGARLRSTQQETWDVLKRAKATLLANKLRRKARRLLGAE